MAPRIRKDAAVRLTLVEPRVLADRALVDLTDEQHDCGNGRWCLKCRLEIREEALRWIRVLNAPPQWELSATPMPVRAWHPELLLGDT
jgi:hypothetical protein